MSWPTDSARTKNWGTEILTDGDLEGQFDLLHAWINAALNGTSGHDHSAGTNEGPKIDLTTSVTEALPVANGGTGQSSITAFLNLIYPVGSIYFNAAVATNPASLLGFGTWVAYAAGQVMVGLDAGQTEFDTLGETGGEKTHTLDTTEIPAHTHSVTILSGGSGLGNGGNSNCSTSTTGSTGGGAAHNNLQPYIVVYMWRRTV